MLAFLVTTCADDGPASAAISLNPSITYQTVRGWEVAILSTVLDYKPVLPAFDKLLDQAANDLGITRIQLAVSSGVEHPPGYAERYLSGAMSERDLVRHYAYDIINDNADPNIANTNGFEFTLLDWRMERMVLPFKRLLEARGEKLYTYLSYVDFGRSAFEHHEHPEEYAEFMLVLFNHLKTRYGFVPDGINVMNEPDNTGWTGAAMGQAIAKTAPRLAAAGYHPDFIAPSTVDRSRAVPLFDAIVAVPGARQYVKELSYHCYADRGAWPFSFFGIQSRSLQAIAARAVQYGVNTTMNECWRSDNTYQTLHKDLKVGRNSAWQQGSFVGSEGYYAVDSANFQVSLRPKTKFMRQYYKYVRPGAKRIEAVTTNQSLDPLAFVSADGKYVTVIKSESPGVFSIENLPAGIYGISYTTAAEFDAQLPDVTLASGQELTASIPAIGVSTVYAKSPRHRK